MSTNKLKAWVRYDGSGRAVAGSLILQRSKPKVGNWKQVPSQQCCGAGDCSINTYVENDYICDYFV
jgi:hypothetical protein